jgi:methylglutamate dehydrogenase subunit D
MVDASVVRSPALEGHYVPGQYGVAGQSGIVFQEMKDLTLVQVAAWSETLDQVSGLAAKAAGVAVAPGPGLASANGDAALLRIEPLKYWLVGVKAPDLEPQAGATLDLSHSRTHLRISGPQAAALLNRFLPLDLREASFPVGSVASTAFHNVGITMWRSGGGYEVFLPRGFALSLWQLLCEGAAQFGYEVV